MSWKSAINRAVKELKMEEARIARELSAIRDRIQGLGGIAGGRTSVAKTVGRRKVSAKGRAAIARAAKKRWAKWRAEKAAN